MKLALIGATGFVGRPILTEALSRPELAVTALVRNPAGLPAHERLRAVSCDARDPAALTAALIGHDAVIHAFHPGRGATSDTVYDASVSGHKAIVAAVKAAGIQRLLTVGGAASLMTPEGVEYIESSLWDKEFDPYKPAILGTRALFYLLKEEKELDWVFLAPSAWLRPGQRTGKFRVGADALLFDANGESRISLEDYAVAMIDELLTPRHHRERFTVGY